MAIQIAMQFYQFNYFLPALDFQFELRDGRLRVNEVATDIAQKGVHNIDEAIRQLQFPYRRVMAAKRESRKLKKTSKRP